MPATATTVRSRPRVLPGHGLFWLLAAALAAGFYFIDGLDALLTAWQRPEYSHGPLIPVLSGLLFLRQLKEYPPETGPVRDRWVGVLVLLGAIAFGTAGKLANISDIVAYATILWVGAILLIGFGWNRGKHFWPPVLHLIYMLPLPAVLYFKVSNSLQFISSELGVQFLRMLSVPVYLEGNIIDLGVLRLHVADACSGLRYLFPILSFSYIFAVLYRGPIWHKAVLLISAVPIAVLMNSVRIAVAGVLAQKFGVEWLEGFTHFFEGWVVFVACIALLFLLARVMLFFHERRMGLAEALDLDTTGLGTQVLRLRNVQASGALIAAVAVMVAVNLAWLALPQRNGTSIERDPFTLFPRQLADWEQTGPREILPPEVERALQADDYHSVNFVHAVSGAPVGFFSAWYADQSNGGIHSPEICLPGSGWEIAWLQRLDITEEIGTEMPFNINKAVIQRGESRMLVYYWFEQKGRKVAWDFAARFYLLADGVRSGRTDGAIVRLTTPILDGETEAAAQERLTGFLKEVLPPLPRFVPQL
ncbi:exosortase D (VPLPA-CTERM-specific) [Cereibacter ovatus]|uniref:Exosortase D (VPLPA-CTERM-specific) n=1 Tax=Cereibacter ovatus TaxID=439529 RepID=A0A285D4P0_9RHOB|nr:VPLPA-CTERM-specific exosortase XrtD [Cereibacter ovatus]SNX74278.1 exosortase D (VPLPA-CTERM-specific) [Cereibacter ovatus]